MSTTCGRPWFLVAALLIAALSANASVDSGSAVPLLFAYVDPGSAGFVIVTVLGFLSAAAYTFRAYVGRLKDRLLPPKDDGRAEAPADDDAAS